MFKIYDGRTEFYQWDLDRKIIVADPAINEVHFCNKTDDCSLVVEVYEFEGQRVANVPNVLLQTDWDIRVYGYCGDSYTKQAARFKVKARTKPADYIYTETEVRTLDYLEDKLDEIEAMAKGAVGGQSFIDYPALIETLNAASNKDYAQAQHMLIKTLGVPDVWVYEVSAEYKPYTYVDDETFAAALVNELPQVGFYILSALETQKVDLAEYVKNTDYASATNTGVVKVSKAHGTNIDVGGIIKTEPASRAVIDLKANSHMPIVSNTIEYATMSSLADCKDTSIWTEQNKAKACETIGALPLSHDAPNQAVKKKVYAIDYNGNQVMIVANVNQESDSLVLRDGAGRAKVVAPKDDKDIANKEYVDDAIAAAGVSGTQLYLHKITDSYGQQFIIINKYSDSYTSLDELVHVFNEDADEEQLPFAMYLVHEQYKKVVTGVDIADGILDFTFFNYNAQALESIGLSDISNDEVTEY